MSSDVGVRVVALDGVQQVLEQCAVLLGDVRQRFAVGQR